DVARDHVRRDIRGQPLIALDMDLIVFLDQVVQMESAIRPDIDRAREGRRAVLRAKLEEKKLRVGSAEAVQRHRAGKSGLPVDKRVDGGGGRAAKLRDLRIRHGIVTHLQVVDPPFGCIESRRLREEQEPGGRIERRVETEATVQSPPAWILDDILQLAVYIG